VDRLELYLTHWTSLTFWLAHHDRSSTYSSDVASLDRYFFHFAMAARAGR